MSTTSVTIPEWMNFDEDAAPASAVGEAAAAHLPEVKSHKLYNGEVEIFFEPAPHVYFLYRDGVRVDIDSVTTVLHVIDKSTYLTPWAAKVTLNKLKELMLNPDGSVKDFSTEELLAWFEEARKEHKKELNKAGDIGTLAHNTLEAAITYAIENTGGVVQVCPTVSGDAPNRYEPAPDPQHVIKAQNCVNRAHEWMVAHNVRWIATEYKIYSREYNYTGTGDGDAIIDSCNDRFCRGCQGRVFKDRRAIPDWKSSNQLADSYAYQTAAYLFARLEEDPTLYIPDRWILRLGKEEGDFEAWYLPDEYFEADFEAFLSVRQLYSSLEEIQERRKADRAAFRDRVRAIKKEEREAAEAVEKQQKAEARAALAAAKQEWDDAAAAYYKELRAQKISKPEAEKQRDEKFPKSQRPGAKTDEPTTPVTPEIVIAEHKLSPATPAPKPLPKPTQTVRSSNMTAAPGTWSMKL